MSKLYSYEEIAAHNTTESAWIIIKDKVYDVTKFLDSHPGGDEIILELAGQDATQDFEDIGHSNDALEFLDALLLGPVDLKSPKAVPQPDAKNAKNDPNALQGNGAIVIVAAVIFFATAIYMSH
ncbi:hypothetical protein TBLA_0B01310 [Henningerozyma blattae CBS 6284]|uniref:Cytochrome b5 heme-binding domain-containing protein n=1 Tax=Henningerozyma blattae (strain ATCC 34711 / CBS 6284 / DSM 70876 / NBRC 10599 / NRRL Y-10934 / UCD 77-7) TaxID=1071380 RepID=I2GXX2_HENB6|nr:hypothetical protein TBLA_0B01310 [Tetrapisispora blattae CBS 6284]CCH58974.1 hypothetical protein TBLA_0B01310 [Tetrapisispora blattae CBS 6284]